jgi:hypothetical protein
VPARAERRCAACGSPLADDQRYCLQCGTRSGARDPRVAEMMQRARDGWPAAADAQPGVADGAAAPSAASPPSTPATASADAGSRAGALTLPSRRVSALLVAGFLGFGILLGEAAANRPPGALSARSEAPLRLLLPHAGSATTPQPAPAAEAPASESEATPEPSAAATPAPASASGSAGANSQGASGSSGSSGSGGSAGSGGGSGGGSSSTAPATTLPPVKHVFVIMLSDEPYAGAFGPASASHYLSTTLLAKGELLARYDAIAHEELANEIALLSGQGPTAQTAANCPTYAPIAPATTGASEQVEGSGCVYPAGAQTLLGQLTAKHLSWRAYLQAIGEPGGAAGPCSHPAPGAPDPSAEQTAATGPYATFRNPFVYFASLASAPACSDQVGIGALAHDLARPAGTPSFAYIVPDRCHDGNPVPCSPGAPAGMAAADGFLRRVVAQITGSAAFRKAGLLVITGDEAPSTGEFADSSSCCGQPSFPNLPAATGGSLRHGGGDVGALLLSPWVKGGTTSQEPFSHFSLLRTIEDLFGLGHIGYAALPAVPPLAPALFTRSPVSH